ncbi:MAG: hypothetical protein ACHQCF_00135 [Solirubrobacterales bacterium]
MPLEGHYRRVNTPLRRLTPRERRVVVWGILVTVVALLGLVLATAGDSRPGPAPGCIRATVAGRTGGEPVNACGAEAVATCKKAADLEGPWAESVLGACTEARIKF